MAGLDATDREQAITATRLLVLVADRQPRFLSRIRRGLERQGIWVRCETDSEEVMRGIAESQPDAVILGGNLSPMSGVELCRQIRRSPRSRTLPTILMTECSMGPISRERTLANDYILKPFDIAELAARLRAVLHRAAAGDDGEILRIGDLTLDLGRHVIARSGRPVRFHPTEFRLLRLLMQEAGRIIPTKEIISRVFGHDPTVDQQAVSVHIYRLRKAINDHGAQNIIRTVRNGCGIEDDHAGP